MSVEHGLLLIRRNIHYKYLRQSVQKASGPKKHDVRNLGYFITRNIPIFCRLTSIVRAARCKKLRRLTCSHNGENTNAVTDRIHKIYPYKTTDKFKVLCTLILIFSVLGSLKNARKNKNKRALNGLS
jgi:hypothetical protein